MRTLRGKRQRQQLRQQLRQQKQPTRRGGRLVSQGAYGCGFYPALRCSNNTVSDPTLFSKFMLTADADAELAEVAKVAELDPDNRYALYPIKTCEMNPENATVWAPNFAKCRLIKENHRLPNNLPQFRVLQLPTGKMDLAAYQHRVLMSATIGEHRRIFGGLRNLLVGLKTFHDASLYHMDIKAANIVVDDDVECRFIDFGLSTTGAPRSLYKVPYFVFPFELQLLGLNFDRIAKAVDGQLLAVIDAFYKKRQNFETPYNSLFTDVGQPRITVDFFRNVLIPLLKGKPAKYFFEKADVFAMGQVLAQVFLNTMNIIIKNEAPYRILSDGVTLREIPFSNIFYKFCLNGYDRLHDLALDMTDPNPDLRPPMDIILARYDIFLRAYDTFLASEPAASRRPVSASVLGKRPRGNGPTMTNNNRSSVSAKDPSE